MKVRWLIPLGAAAALPAYHAAYAVQYMSVEQAQRAAFAQAEGFVDVPLTLTEAQRRALDQGEAALSISAPKIWQARAGQKNLGWLIVDQVIGKAEAISYALALDNDGKIIALDVLEYRETHGAEIRLPAWRKQFVGKTAQDSLRLDGDIRNISGATLSCRHLTDGVRRLVQLYAQVLKPTSG